MKHRIALRSICALVFVVGAASAADSTPDIYKIRIEGSWWYVNPTGSITAKIAPNTVTPISTASVSGSPIDVQKDFGFHNYSTFAGFVDWRFTRRQHLIVSISPNSYTGSHNAERDFVFNGATITTGTAVNSKLRVTNVAPGYEFNFIQRNHGHLGIIAQCNLLDINTDVHATGSIILPDQTVTGSYSKSRSLFAPLPVFGPQFRVYTPNGKVYVDGAILAMYFFGYGQFISSRGTVGLKLNKSFSLHAGYLMGSRTIVHGETDRLGIDLTQKGPAVGVEGQW